MYIPEILKRKNHYADTIVINKLRRRYNIPNLCFYDLDLDEQDQVIAEANHIEQEAGLPGNLPYELQKQWINRTGAFADEKNRRQCKRYMRYQKKRVEKHNQKKKLYNKP